jgi:cytoskeletal protein RodZ
MMKKHKDMEIGFSIVLVIILGMGCILFWTVFQYQYYNINITMSTESSNTTVSNCKTPNTMVYRNEDCVFNTDRQEYWCVDTAQIGQGFRRRTE